MWQDKLYLHWQEGIRVSLISICWQTFQLYLVSQQTILLFGQMEITEEEERILSYLEQLDQEDAEYIRNIKKKGFYDIIDQDLQNSFRIIDIPFFTNYGYCISPERTGL